MDRSIHSGILKSSDASSELVGSGPVDMSFCFGGSIRCGMNSTKGH